MHRMHLFEIMDLPGCPAVLRDAMTDYLQHVQNVTNPYRPIVPLLAKAVCEAQAKQIIDLGAGAGGPWQRLYPEIETAGISTPVLLTDRYPHQASLLAEGNTASGIQFHPDPVDAMQVPPSLSGFRTLFSAFHHFPPQDAQAILQDAVTNRQGIGVFELMQRKPVPVLSMLLVPLFVLLITPFIRPVRLSRILLTYVLPIIPLAAMFDGFVSCLRTYTPSEMEKMTQGLTGEPYHWEAGEARLKGVPGVITYLIGYPANPLKPQSENRALTE